MYPRGLEGQHALTLKIIGRSEWLQGFDKVVPEASASMTFPMPWGVGSSGSDVGLDKSFFRPLEYILNNPLD